MHHFKTLRYNYVKQVNETLNTDVTKKVRGQKDKNVQMCQVKKAWFLMIL